MVVVIIGILVAIAIPLYLNYENGARNKSAASDLRGAISAIEQCNSDDGEIPPAFTATGSSYSPCANQAINLSNGTTVADYVDAADDAYMLVAYQGDATTWYCYNSSVGGAITTESGALDTSYATC